MLSDSLGTEFTQAHIERAAKVTFANVVLLSLLCTVIDGIRRRVMVEMLRQEDHQSRRQDDEGRLFRKDSAGSGHRRQERFRRYSLLL